MSTTHSEEDTTASVHQPLPQPPAEIPSTSTIEMMSTPSIQRPTTKTAAELFGHNNSSVGTLNSLPNDATTMTETQQPTTTTTTTCTVVNDNNNNCNNHNMSNEDELDDVPLTPGQDHVSKLSEMNDTLMNMTMAGNAQPSNEALPSLQQQQQQPSIVTTGMNSLIAAIGMPPPPFSRK
jgi:hypothetical protein